MRGDSIHFVFVLVIIQVNGIKGASVFLLFKPFDLVKGFVVDWMHSVCLGSVKITDESLAEYRKQGK